MTRVFTLLLTLLLAATALAGCTEPGTDSDSKNDDDTDMDMEPSPTPVTATPNMTPTPDATPTDEPVLDSSSYVLETMNVPGQVMPGQVFNFTLFANGTANATSDHIGAHYADNDTVNPPVSPGRGDCEHQNGTLPGSFVVQCTLAAQGTYHVWGHARITSDGAPLNWWTAAPTVVKVRTYDLNASAFPSNPPTSKQNFTFSLTVNGTDNATTNHLGAHFWNATEANPTVANAAGNCDHLPDATGAIGKHTITCNIENGGAIPKDFFVRGHLLLTEGETTLNWWSNEVKVSILGVPTSPL